TTVPTQSHVLTKAPVLIKNVSAVYPDQAKAEKLNAEVEMQIVIDAVGKVGKVTITNPAGHGFDQAAIAAVQQFVFTPPEVDGQPSAITIVYTEHFLFSPPPASSLPASQPADGSMATREPSEWPVAIQGVLRERGTRTLVPGAQVLAQILLARQQLR